MWQQQGSFHRLSREREILQGLLYIRNQCCVGIKLNDFIRKMKKFGMGIDR